MLTLISPAKTLDFSVPDYNDFSNLEFQKETHQLVSIMKKKKAADIQELMGVSGNLAQLNEERYKDF
jgi:cytoplasmic iron level regulating protein YaaA (DUF328/UPF0246 family)